MTETEHMAVESDARKSKLWIFRHAVIGIGVFSTLALLLAEYLFRAINPTALFSSNQVKTVPYLFQVFASDDLMQTVKIQDLVNFGPSAFWYFHIQPPLHQAIVYALALPEALTESPITSETVDMRLYVFHAVIFGLLNALIYLWARDLLRSGKWALVIVIIWSIYPGNLQMATLLDGTYLSLYLITLTFYFLYRFLKTRMSRYITFFLIALALASYTRSIFQIHIMVVLVVAVICFWWIQKDPRRWGRMVIDVLLVLLMIALPVKAYLMFGSFSTTTYGGYHRTGMLWYDPTVEAYNAIPVPAHITANAEVFKSSNNLPVIAEDNYKREQLANEWLKDHPLSETLSVLKRSADLNFQTALLPTSSYFENNFAQGAPWRAPMDWLLSGYLYLLIELAALVVIAVKRGAAGSWRLLRRYGWLIALYLMVAGTIALQNRNDWSEANRLKIFLEIPAWLAIAYAVRLVTTRKKSRRRQEESTVT
jgi:hypothetical protein